MSKSHSYKHIFNLNQIELPQVELQDRVLDSSKDKTNIFCVCGTSEVGVNYFLLVGVLILIQLQNEVSGSFDILFRS